MTTMRDGTQVADPRFGRIYEHDARDYPASVALTVAEPVSVSWNIPAGEPVLDQGQEGSCVGHGVTNDLRFAPVAIGGLTSVFAVQSIYWPAQRIDEFAGGAYPGAQPRSEGTSVRAGVKAAKALGFYGEYRFARSEAEMALALAQYGPVIIGVNWYRGMMRPDRNGYLNPTGAVQGGHCVLVVALKVTSPPGAGYYTIYNSWGPGWGRQGTARIRRNVMARLLAERGDACVITQRFDPTANPTAA